MAAKKPAAKEITAARLGARRAKATTGETRAHQLRRPGTPTKKRPAGGTSLTANAALERPAPPPAPKPPRPAPTKTRAGRRVPKQGRAVRASEAERRD